MKTLLHITQTLVLALLFTANCNAQYFEISKKNAKHLAIVTQIESTPDEKNAAQLLKNYLDTIFSSRFRIEISKIGNRFINLHTDSTIPPDGFEIQIGIKSIDITGGSRKGCTYAVIELLERYFGCMYLSPDYRIVPKQEKVKLIPYTFSEIPKNDVRIINLYFDENQEYSDWLRLNSIDEVYPKGYFVHTFHRLIPWETYFEKHPEYFALVNGKRTIDQLCTSNPEVRDLIAEKLKKEMALQPEKVKWSVSQNDNFSYCQCEKCKHIIEEEGGPAGPIIHLVNDIAARFPDKIISTLAYQYSRKAPEKVKPLSNVEVMLCTIELHRHLPIETNPESADFKKDMEDWGKICSNIFLWDYTINFNHSISPFPNLHILQPNIQFFTKNNVNALFEQSNSTTGYEFSEMKAYLLSKLMWNPELDFENEKSKFIASYYGSAAPSIEKYIQELEKTLKENESKLWIYEHPVVHQDGLFSEENLKKFKLIFENAEIAVANDPVLLNHVKLARLPLQYAEMEIATNNMFSKRGWYEIEAGKTIPNQQLLKTLNDFEKTCLQNKVKSVNESELIPQNYISSLRRMIAVEIEGNLAFGRNVSTSTPPDKKYQKGDLSYLTNGVNGASDYNIHWLGWFGNDTELTLELDDITTAKNISINSLWNGKSWILHPAQIQCSISIDGEHYISIGTQNVKGEQQREIPIRTYLFDANGEAYRYVKFTVNGTMKLPNWHPSAGEASWFFLDEITVK
jgi:hypothetical protein